jgi:hypothetical protein
MSGAKANGYGEDGNVDGTEAAVLIEVAIM